MVCRSRNLSGFDLVSNSQHAVKCGNLAAGRLKLAALCNGQATFGGLNFSEKFFSLRQQSSQNFGAPRLHGGRRVGLLLRSLKLELPPQPPPKITAATIPTS